MFTSLPFSYSIPNAASKQGMVELCEALAPYTFIKQKSIKLNDKVLF